MSSEPKVNIVMYFLKSERHLMLVFVLVLFSLLTMYSLFDGLASSSRRWLDTLASASSNYIIVYFGEVPAGLAPHSVNKDVSKELGVSLDKLYRFIDDVKHVRGVSKVYLLYEFTVNVPGTSLGGTIVCTNRTLLLMGLPPSPISIVSGRWPSEPGEVVAVDPSEIKELIKATSASGTPSVNVPSYGVGSKIIISDAIEGPTWPRNPYDIRHVNFTFTITGLVRTAPTVTQVGSLFSLYTTCELLEKHVARVLEKYGVSNYSLSLFPPEMIIVVPSSSGDVEMVARYINKLIEEYGITSASLFYNKALIQGVKSVLERLGSLYSLASTISLGLMIGVLAALALLRAQSDKNAQRHLLYMQSSITPSRLACLYIVLMLVVTLSSLALYSAVGGLVAERLSSFFLPSNNWVRMLVGAGSSYRSVLDYKLASVMIAVVLLTPIILACRILGSERE